MKPKYLLTHPNGQLMISKALEDISLDQFDQVYITILREHVEQYEAETILHQIFAETEKVRILILEEPTFCQAETVYETIRGAGITGEIVIKDSDNHVAFDDPEIEPNTIAGVDIERFPDEIARLREKSFLSVNDQSIVIDIVEKQIKSKYICVGVYSFASADVFCDAFEILKENNFCNQEIYISHVVSYLIGTGKGVFFLKTVRKYDDWGTRDEWEREQQLYRTFFVDLDGVLCKNRGKYGTINWDNSFELLKENVEVLKRLSCEGAQIVITTSRDRKYEKAIRQTLEEQGIHVFAMVTNCNHACRVIINDFASTNPYPSCLAINIPRNGKLSDYLR